MNAGFSDCERKMEIEKLKPKQLDYEYDIAVYLRHRRTHTQWSIVLSKGNVNITQLILILT